MSKKSVKKSVRYLSTKNVNVDSKIQDLNRTDVFYCDDPSLLVSFVGKSGTELGILSHTKHHYFPFTGIVNLFEMKELPIPKNTKTEKGKQLNEKNMPIIDKNWRYWPNFNPLLEELLSKNVTYEIPYFSGKKSFLVFIEEKKAKVHVFQRSKYFIDNTHYNIEQKHDEKEFKKENLYWYDTKIISNLKFQSIQTIRQSDLLFIKIKISKTKYIYIDHHLIYSFESLDDIVGTNTSSLWVKDKSGNVYLFSYGKVLLDYDNFIISEENKQKILNLEQQFPEDKPYLVYRFTHQDNKDKIQDLKKTDLFKAHQSYFSLRNTRQNK